MHNIVEINKRNLIIKSDYKLTEKIVTMYQKNKISREEFVDKLGKLKIRLQDNFARIKELNKKIEETKSEDINYYIAEHLLTNAQFDIASKFISEKQIIIDFDFFLNLDKMKDNIRKHGFDNAYDFIKENKLHLKLIEIDYKGNKINGLELENLFKMFTFLELCRQEEKDEAIEYLRKNYKNNQSSIKKYLPMLISKHFEIENDYGVNDIEDLTFVFSEVYLSLYGLKNISRLNKRLIYGIIAYKTKLCSTKINYNCPTCLLSLQPIKDALPFCKRENSIILCKGSNIEMNEKNQPYCFESGYIYCEVYMSQLDYVYTCIVTGKTCKENPKICYFV